MSIIFYNIHTCVLLTKLLFYLYLFSVCVVCMDVHVHLCVCVSVHIYIYIGRGGAYIYDTGTRVASLLFFHFLP